MNPCKPVAACRGLWLQWTNAHVEALLRTVVGMDDEQLKNPPDTDVSDYFDERLVRFRDIRGSERR